MEKKIIYVGNSYKRPWGNLRYQHGTPEEPNQFTFKTLNYTILHDVRRGEIYDYEVRVEPGTYYVSPYTWTPEHNASVTILPYGEGEVIFSAGKKIEGFRETTVNGVRAFVTEISAVKNGEWYFEELYVNKSPRRRPVLPKNNEKFRIKSVPGHTENDCAGVHFFEVEEGIFDKITNIEDTVVEVIHFWLSERFPVVSYDEKTHVVYSSAGATRELCDDVAGGYAKYRIANVFEAMTEPGEWYLNRKTGMLYYIPMENETCDNILVEAPYYDSLLTLRGYPTKPISNITFKNITFENVKYAPYKNAATDRKACYGQAAGNCDGAISLAYAKHVNFEGCTVRNIGNYGIEFGSGCTYNTVTGCHLYQFGAGAIRMTGGHISINAENGSPEGDVMTGFNRIENNHIHDCAMIDYGAVAIWIAHGSSNRIAHNEIHDMKYSGISVGWVWGMLPSPTNNNIIEYNHIYRCGDGDMSDMGGIYLLGPQGGTEVRGNYIHDIHRANYGGWGIYLDEGSTNILVERNVIYDCDSEAMFIHYGRENIIRYNIFGGGIDAVIGFGAGVEATFGNFMKNLFFVGKEAVYFGDYNYDFKQRWLFSDCNFIYKTEQTPLWNLRYGPTKETWEEWLSNGADAFSIVYENASPVRPTSTPKELIPYGFPSDVDAKKAGIVKN